MSIFGLKVERGEISGEISKIDLAPTILTLIGVPVPGDMTGRILHESGNLAVVNHE